VALFPARATLDLKVRVFLDFLAEVFNRWFSRGAQERSTALAGPRLRVVEGPRADAGAPGRRRLAQ